MVNDIILNEENIHRLFGPEAAEDEDPQRLREYYFKVSAYEQVTANLPVRVLVGHKGIGKSALFKVAMTEDQEKNELSLLIQPNDIADLGVQSNDFLHTIRSWTRGLNKIIIKKVFEQIGVHQEQTGEFDKSDGRILNYLQKNLNEIKQSIDDKKLPLLLSFLDRSRVKVYIDDLDRGWQGKLENINRISALLNAVRDMSNKNPGLMFKIALRSDVYYLVRTSDESTDKIEGSVVWHTWSNHEIFIMLIKRIENFFERTIDGKSLLLLKPKDLAHYLNPIMEPRFTGKGHWNNAPIYRVIMSLIRKRPRDLVKLLTLAAKKSYSRNSPRIQTKDFESIFEEYSQGRIQDTINEYRSELPSIEKLLMNMKPNRAERQLRKGFSYKTEELLEKIKRISESNKLLFFNGSEPTPKDLAAFLFKINFITARKETSEGVIRKYFEENRYLVPQFADFGFDWEVHPAYRWALQPDTINDIYDSVRLDSDD
jgi:hypothetical protein